MGDIGSMIEICTDLCERHPVGMFPDLSQPEPLLHLSIPSGRKKQAELVILYIFRVDGGILNLAMQVM